MTFFMHCDLMYVCIELFMLIYRIGNTYWLYSLNQWLTHCWIKYFIAGVVSLQLHIVSCSIKVLVDIQLPYHYVNVAFNQSNLNIYWFLSLGISNAERNFNVVILSMHVNIKHGLIHDISNEGMHTHTWKW